MLKSNKTSVQKRPKRQKETLREGAEAGDSGTEERIPGLENECGRAACCLEVGEMEGGRLVRRREAVAWKGRAFVAMAGVVPMCKAAFTT